MKTNPFYSVSALVLALTSAASADIFTPGILSCSEVSTGRPSFSLPLVSEEGNGPVNFNGFAGTASWRPAFHCFITRADQEVCYKSSDTLFLEINATDEHGISTPFSGTATFSSSGSISAVLHETTGQSTITHYECSIIPLQ